MIVQRYIVSDMPHNPLRTDEEAETVGVFFADNLGTRASAEDVVGLARPKESPLHSFFEWRDRLAASEYRREQARRLLRSVKIVAIRDDGEEFETRAWEHVTIVSEEGVRSAYVPASIVWETRDLADVVTGRLRRELEALAARYKQYEHLASTISDLVEVAEKIAV